MKGDGPFLQAILSLQDAGLEPTVALVTALGADEGVVAEPVEGDSTDWRSLRQGRG